MSTAIVRRGLGTVENGSILVSIIINNYNYGRFLRDAIDSALNQPHCNTEVLVVDDGSTDCSRAIIASYGQRIKPVLKDNGGQASAFNAGFERSHGDIVIFLDSDDTLLPATVPSIVEIFQSNPLVARVQFRLELIDGNGQATGVHMPPAELSMPSGDLRKHTLCFPDDIRTPPTSGNAFAAAVLHRILPMPIPEAAYGRTGADLYLHNLVPLFGSVESLGPVGGRYRIHESNHQYTTGLNLHNIRRMIIRTRVNHEHIRVFASALGLPGVPDDSADILSVTFLVNRMASLKLEPELHPVDNDSIARLLRLGIMTSWRRFDVSLRTRALFALWFVAAACSPKGMVKWLVVRAFYPEHRGMLRRLVT